MASSIIFAVRAIGGGQPEILRRIEKASETFIAGTPIMLDTGTGGMKAWDGATVAKGIAGVAKEPASNLSTLGTAKTLTFGSVPFEASAVNIPRGAPLNDGRVGFEQANDLTEFFAQVGPAQTTAVTDLFKEYGMTKDSDGHWYVDKTKSNAGVDTVVTVVKLDTVDTTRGVIFKFSKASQQVV